MRSASFMTFSRLRSVKSKNSNLNIKSKNPKIGGWRALVSLLKTALLIELNKRTNNICNSDLGGGRRALEPGGEDPGVREGRPHQDKQQTREQAEAAVSQVTPGDT